MGRVVALGSPVGPVVSCSPQRCGFESMYRQGIPSASKASTGPFRHLDSYKNDDQDERPVVGEPIVLAGHLYLLTPGIKIHLRGEQAL